MTKLNLLLVRGVQVDLLGLCRLYNPVPLAIPLLLEFQGFHPNPEKLVKISLDYLGQNMRFDKLLMVDQDRVIK